MDINSLRDYHFYEFAEEHLGFYLTGSGRRAEIVRNKNEVVLNIKRFTTSGDIHHNFIFTDEKCMYSRRFCKYEDITQYWQNYLSRLECGQ